MDRSIIAVFCAILTLAHSNAESRSWQLNQPTGKMTKDDSLLPKITPLPFSSIVYLDDSMSDPFSLGVLISPEYALLDGTCPIIIMPTCIYEKVYYGALKMMTRVCHNILGKSVGCSFVKEVFFEKSNAPEGLAVVKLFVAIEISEFVSLAYLPAENEWISGKKVVTVFLSKDKVLEKELNQHIIYLFPTAYKISQRREDLQQNDITVGAPLFQGKNLIGIGSINKNVDEGPLRYFRQLRLSCEFLGKFVPCGQEFNRRYYDPAQNGIKVGESSNQGEEE